MGSEAPTGEMLTLDAFKDGAAGLGFARIETVPGSTYRASHVAIICPLRSPMIHVRVAQAIYGLVSPPNQQKGIWFPHGHEVGIAYNECLKQILAHPDISKWPYVLTIEDDQIPPPDAILRLIESLEASGFDAMSGIYFTKGDFNVPQCWGDAGEYMRTGQLNFRPVNPLAAVHQGASVVEVNGIGMGCALFRMGLFREIPEPWFVTTCDWQPDKGGRCYTQDLFFWEKARKAGKRCGVDLRVRVGHMDTLTQTIY